MIYNLPDIKKEVVLNAPIDKVWEFITTAENFASWFMPIKGEFKLERNYEFQIVSPFGPINLTLSHIDAPYKLTYTIKDIDWFATIELSNIDGNTRFNLTHGGWGKSDETFEKAGKSNKEVYGTMDVGWDLIVNFKLKMAIEC